MHEDDLMKRVWIAIGCLVAALGGCASTPRGKSDYLGFLDPGVTTREVVTERLGTPSAAYEGGRILTYWVAADEGGYYRPDPDNASFKRYSLILVFRSDGLLDRHSLVLVRGK